MECTRRGYFLSEDEEEDAGAEGAVGAGVEGAEAEDEEDESDDDAEAGADLLPESDPDFAAGFALP